MIPLSRTLFPRSLRARTSFIFGLLGVSLLNSCTTPTETAEPDPHYILYTYEGNPSTSITVNWQTFAPVGSDPAVLVRPISVKEPSKTSRLVTGFSHHIDGKEDRFLHRARIDGLEPATTYFITVAGQNGQPLPGAPEHKIRTIPDDDRPLRFVTGGDMGTSEEVRTLLKHAAAQDPAFAAVGGDIAYADGQLEKADKWDIWMTYYVEEMVTPDGYQIPLLLAVGNHEVNGAYNQPVENSPFFRNYFAQDPEENYFARRFGQNLILLALDSGHTASHEEQSPWIREILTEHSDATHTAAIYHVPLYPSHRDYLGKYSDLGRKHWAPVFDEMNLTVAFENHDHTYKRSHLLKGDKVTTDGSGTLYLGDGCWGRDARTVEFEERWYLKHSDSVLHFWNVEVSKEGMIYKAIDLENRVFDVYPEDHPEAAAAAAVRESFENTYIFPSDSVNCTPLPVKDGLWTGGKTTITVGNPFSHPMSILLDPSASRRVTVEGFPETPFVIAPGEQHSLDVHFAPDEGLSMPERRARTRFYVRGSMTPKNGEVANFEARIWVPKIAATP